jgi:hypothetical protein
MRMMMRYQNGLRVEAVILAASRERMRVAIDSQGDTAELHQVNSCWFTESGTKIEIEALIPIQEAATSRFCEAVYPRTMTAGQSFSWD